MGIGDDNKIYNINADIAAGSIAKKLNSRRLLLMTDVEGVLDKDKNLISEINSAVAEEMLKDGEYFWWHDSKNQYLLRCSK